MSDAVKFVHISTNAPSQVVVRDARGRKLFEMDLQGVAITVATLLDADITILPDERNSK
jgi:hypothetical protein